MMQKKSILVLSIFVLLISIPTALCNSPTPPIVYVDTDGSGDYNCDGTDDHVKINNAISFIATHNDFTTVHLNGSNIYWIDDPIYLRNNMIFEGDSDAVVKLVDNANWERKDYGLIDVKGIVPGGDGVDNVTIRGFKIDGNRENQPGLKGGRGFYNAIKLRRGWNIEIYNMYICNNLNDGVLIDHTVVETKPVNINIHDNIFYEVGHDGVYLKRLSHAKVHNNIITCNINAGIRTHDSNNIAIYNNTINSNHHGGAGISIGKSDLNLVDNVEIYNNVIYETALWGILLASRGSSTPSTSTGVHIHHNLIYGTGTSHGDQRTAGICVYGFHNTIIESNTLDYNRKIGIGSAIDGMAKVPTSGTGFVTIVRNNIITKTRQYSYDSNSGYGIENKLSNTHSFKIDYNCFHDNDNVDFKNVNSGIGNIFSDPQFVKWKNHEVTGIFSDYHLQLTSPCINAGHLDSDYSNEPEPNGNRIDIGRYGNTAEVSKSISDKPTASAGIDQTVTAGDTITLDGSASTDDVGISSYVWDFDASDDLQQDANGAAVQHTYNTAGTYTPTLTVTDTDGNADSDTVIITVNEGSITLPPNETASSVYDNRLREVSPDVVLFDNDYVDIGHRTDKGRYRDVIWFNLSMYNTTDTISNATLSLYWYYPKDSTRNKDTVVEIYRPVDWNPNYVSWNHRTFDTPWNTPGGDWFDMNEVAQGSVSYASVTFTDSDVPDNRYYKFDVTELVQNYISGEYDNTGFLLKAQDEYDNYIAFYSSDWSNVDQRPKLTVTLNHAPVLTSIGPRTVDEESVLSFTASASDVDGDDLIYSVSGLPTGATFDSTSGLFTWTSASGQAGTYQVTFEVTDGHLIDSETITLTVNEGSITPTPNETASSIYDNRLREASPDVVLFDNDYVDIGHITGAARYRDVMWFNLNMYNTTDTISNATLSLYWYYPEDSTRNKDTVIEIYRPVNWDPDYVSWNYRTFDTLWNTPGGDWFDMNEVAQGSVSYASVTFTGSDVPDNKFYEFDVTELVQNYISGKYDNTGFLLKAQDEYDNYIAFYSSDWSNVDQRPKLTVTLNHSPVLTSAPEQWMKGIH